ncbi:MAG TPA: alanine racemase [Candidatus Acidoferrales bacterium]|nr:alanine racemase [Candidatus Acidoferrales bacterium]
MKHNVQFEGRPVWAEVSLGALDHNLRAIRRHINGSSRRGGPKILAVVKANAYGLGAVPVAKTLAMAGADWFGVTSTAEGAELREAGIRQPILVLTGFWPGEERRLLQYRLTPAITECEQLGLLERAAASFGSARGQRARSGPVGFHLKIDTGMNRLGIRASDAECFARALGDCPHLRLEGTFTHFASAEVFTVRQTEAQQKRFSEALERLRALHLRPGLVHLANSAAVAARPESWADMVRPGAILYGYHQFYDPAERKKEMEAKLPLQTALSLRTRIISLRDVAPGEGVGYNARFVAPRTSRIAVLAAGYADGLPRNLANRGRVIVRGQFAPLVGTISMDLAMIDVTRIEGARLGDVVTIYGADGSAAQQVSEVAHELGTVTSDLLCALGQRVPRFYLS